MAGNSAATEIDDEIFLKGSISRPFQQLLVAGRDREATPVNSLKKYRGERRKKFGLKIPYLFTLPNEICLIVENKNPQKGIVHFLDRNRVEGEGLPPLGCFQPGVVQLESLLGQRPLAQFELARDLGVSMPVTRLVTTEAYGTASDPLPSFPALIPCSRLNTIGLNYYYVSSNWNWCSH